jgi:hypothetical protein
VLLAYLYVGHLQLAHTAPEVTRLDARRRQVKLVFDALVTGTVKTRRAPGEAGSGNRLSGHGDG